MKTKLLFLLLSFVAITTTAQTKDFEDYWSVQNTNFTELSRGVSFLTVVDQNVAWIMAYDGSGGGANVQEFSTTSDGGVTWTAGAIDVGDPDSDLAMLQGINATTAYAVASPNASGGGTQALFKTSDTGATWTNITPSLYQDADSYLNVVHFWDENVGFLQGDPVDGYFEMYTTVDGGANWTRVPSADIPAPLAGEYGYQSHIFVVGDAIWMGTNKGRLLRSYDKGYTWTVHDTPIPDFSSTSGHGYYTFSDNDNGYLMNQDGTLWKTSDGATTWNLTFPDSGLIFPSGISAVPGTDIVVSTGAGSLKGSSYSTDGGINWIIMSDVQHTAVDFISPTIGWSGNFNGGPDGDDPTIGGIFKFVGDLLAVSDISEIDGFKAYPNPVTDVLNMTSKDEISNVQIFNILGQKVLDQDVNALTARINTAELANGTYIVQITIGDVVGSMKIIK